MAPRSPQDSPEFCPTEKPGGGQWPKPTAGTLDALAQIISGLVASGESRPCKLETSFEGVRAPAISVEEYLRRLMQYFKCSQSCLVLAAAYIDRLLNMKPDFVLDKFNVHRLMLATVTVAAKMHDDTYYPNSWYAQIGGITNQELNLLEAELLRMINWRVHVTAEDFEQYQTQMFAAAGLPLEAASQTKERVEGLRARQLASPRRPDGESGDCCRSGCYARRSLSPGLRLMRRSLRYREPSGSFRRAPQAAF